MAKGVGLDAGEYEVKVVELDGSIRKPRMTKVSIERVSQSALSPADESHAEREAESSLHALKDAKIAQENVCLGFPCREAVLRNITVPFTGVDAIRKVIKFEAEGEIHSHSVDDMVVDFLVRDELEGETRVMVAAIPKLPLQTTLGALRRAGVDPEFVDLDTMALYRAAELCGCFEDPEGSGEEGEGASLPQRIGQQKVRLILDIGARSVRVLAVNEGQLIDVRALRIGVDSVSEEVARSMGISTDSAREAVLSSMRTGEDVVVDGVAPDDEEGDEVEEVVIEDDDEDRETDSAQLQSYQSEIIHHSDVLRARDAFLGSFRRELLRFLSGLPGLSEVEAVHVTGGGSLLGGLDEALEDVFGCPVQRMNVLHHVQHSFEEDEVEIVGPRLAVALGLALHPMGAKPSFDFRQEDLSYTRKFDRIKFPLAVACMFAAFLPFIYGMVQLRKLQNLEGEYGVVMSSGQSENKRGRKTAPEFSGYTGYVYNSNQLSTSVVRYMDDKVYTRLGEDLVSADTFERLSMIEKALSKHLEDRQEETGVYRDLKLDSGYFVMAHLAKIIRGIEDTLGAFLVTELDLSLPYREQGRVL
ncbi:MAG: pilus assembly protein PilM, partial [Planctomycetota bacterium]